VGRLLVDLPAHDLCHGDRVAAWPALVCGQCEFCNTNRENLCRDILLFGYHLDGGFADTLSLSHEYIRTLRLLKVPESVSNEAATFLEPLGCVSNALDKIGRPPTRLLIVGAGLMGRLADRIGIMLPTLAGEGGLIAVAIGLMLLARAIPIYALVPATIRVFSLPRVSRGEQHIMYWGGLRGGLAIAIALSIPDELPARTLIQNLALAAVLFTLLVNAPSIRPVIRRLGIGLGLLAPPHPIQYPRGFTQPVVLDFLNQYLIGIKINIQPHPGQGFAFPLHHRVTPTFKGAVIKVGFNQTLITGLVAAIKIHLDHQVRLITGGLIPPPTTFTPTIKT